MFVVLVVIYNNTTITTDITHNVCIIISVFTGFKIGKHAVPESLL